MMSTFQEEVFRKQSISGFSLRSHQWGFLRVNN